METLSSMHFAIFMFILYGIGFLIHFNNHDGWGRKLLLFFNGFLAFFFFVKAFYLYGIHCGFLTPWEVNELAQINNLFLAIPAFFQVFVMHLYKK
jgi:hypothetical protein